ncbi:MAG: LamG domain-containing protein, partial [Bacteroidia bacterium]|nr:LamG domain-containing protein [Bacteroidia bacterium]
MKLLLRVFSLVFLFAIISCNVDNLNESNTDATNKSNINATNRSSEDECETAFAYYEDGCFIDSDYGFKRWGWNIGPLSDGSNGSFDLYAGAAKCKPEIGMYVGAIEVNYVDGTLTVDYQAEDGYVFYETHLYAGNAEFPTDPKGKPTVAPGQYGNQNEFSEGSSSDSYTIKGLEGDIYIIAHAVVCPMEEECEADAGTIKAEADCIGDNGATITGLPGGDATVPEGYEVLYVLTKGADLVIVDVSSDPSFVVDMDGLYTVHTLVYDPNTLDLSGVELGVTTGGDVYGLLIDGGGDICASLDVTGFSVEIKCNPSGPVIIPEVTADIDAILNLGPPIDPNNPDPTLYDITEFVSFGQPDGVSSADWLVELEIGQSLEIGQPVGLQEGDELLYTRVDYFSDILGHWPLTTDLSDETGNNSDMTSSGLNSPLSSTGPNGVCVEGNVFTGGNYASTPAIAGFDPTNFSVKLDFNISDFGTPTVQTGGNPVIMGGFSWRFIGIEVNSTTGAVGLIWNNGDFSYSSTILNLNEWYTGEIKFSSGTAELYINGTLVHSEVTGTLDTGGSSDFSTNNGGNGGGFTGCIRNLQVAGVGAVSPVPLSIVSQYISESFTDISDVEDPFFPGQGLFPAKNIELTVIGAEADQDVEYKYDIRCLIKRDGVVLPRYYN